MVIRTVEERLAAEALERLIMRAAAIDHKPEPGAVVNRAPADLRKALQNLKSDTMPTLHIGILVSR